MPRPAIGSRARAASARAVRAIREGLALSRADFAARLGVEVRTLKSWELGARVPDAQTMKEISSLK